MYGMVWYGMVWYGIYVTVLPRRLLFVCFARYVHSAYKKTTCADDMLHLEHMSACPAN